MATLWRYIHYDLNLGCIPLGKPFKEPEVFEGTQPELSPGVPDPEYVQVTDEDYLIDYTAKKYPQRKKDGIAFSDRMNARLILYDVPEADKDHIDTFFSHAQLFLEGGRWKSAQREINKKVADTIVSQELIDEIKINIDNYIAAYY